MGSDRQWRSSSFSLLFGYLVQSKSTPVEYALGAWLDRAGVFSCPDWPALRPRSTDVPALFLFPAFPGKGECDEGIANRVITRMPSAQAVTVRRDTSIRDISTEGVNNKLVSIGEGSYLARRRATGLRDVGWRIQRTQQRGCPRV